MMFESQKRTIRANEAIYVDWLVKYVKSGGIF